MNHQRELIEALGAFERWMNRPSKRVQVCTWRLANILGCSSGNFRILAPYRTPNVKEARLTVARAIKDMRKKGFRMSPPIYQEQTGEYTGATPRKTPNELMADYAEGEGI